MSFHACTCFVMPLMCCGMNVGGELSDIVRSLSMIKTAVLSRPFSTQ